MEELENAPAEILRPGTRESEAVYTIIKVDYQGYVFKNRDYWSRKEKSE